MTHDELMRYNKAINTINYKIIERPYDVTTPNTEQLDAMAVAVKAMELQAYDTGRSLKRQIAILTYHICQPSALLFRDKYTLDAMRCGIMAIKYLIGAETGDFKG